CPDLSTDAAHRRPATGAVPDAGGAPASVGHADAGAGRTGRLPIEGDIMKERITVVGNIATVPEQRKLGSGDTVVNFRLAANHGHWDRGAGKWVDGEASFYAVSAYRALGEHALASLHRGERVIVTGTF